MYKNGLFVKLTTKSLENLKLIRFLYNESKIECTQWNATDDGDDDWATCIQGVSGLDFGVFDADCDVHVDDNDGQDFDDDNDSDRMRYEYMQTTDADR